jgi:hypothetical protein
MVRKYTRKKERKDILTPNTEAAKREEKRARARELTRRRVRAYRRAQNEARRELFASSSSSEEEAPQRRPVESESVFLEECAAARNRESSLEPQDSNPPNFERTVST